MVDIPLISKKGDLRVDAIGSIPSMFVNTTISYGLTSNIAIQINGSICPFYSQSINSKINYQGAIGYYKDLGDKTVMEIYSGYGKFNNYSDFEASYSDNYTAYTSKYNIYFSQFNIGKMKEYFDYGLGIKAGLVKSNLEKDLYDNNTNPYQTTLSSSNNFLVEPTFFIRVGGNNLKFNFKLGTCYIFNTSTTSSSAFFPFNLGFGINYSF